MYLFECNNIKEVVYKIWHKNLQNLKISEILF